MVLLLCAALLLCAEKNNTEHLRKGCRIQKMLVCLGREWERSGEELMEIGLVLSLDRRGERMAQGIKIMGRQV